METDDEKLSDKVDELFKQIEVKPRYEAVRIGRRSADKTRPVKISVTNTNSVDEILFFYQYTYFTSEYSNSHIVTQVQPANYMKPEDLFFWPVTVKVVCTILSSPETLLQCAAPHLTLTPHFSSIRLSRPGGCIDHSGSLAERQRRSPHDQADSGIRTRNLTIAKLAF